MSYLLVNVLSPSLEALFFGARFWRLSNSNSYAVSIGAKNDWSSSRSRSSGVLALAVPSSVLSAPPAFDAGPSRNCSAVVSMDHDGAQRSARPQSGEAAGRLRGPRLWRRSGRAACERRCGGRDGCHLCLCHRDEAGVVSADLSLAYHARIAAPATAAVAGAVTVWGVAAAVRRGGQ